MKIVRSLFFISVSLFIGTNYHAEKIARTLRVPSEFTTIAKAVEQSKDGDLIIISPGNYKEKDIEINKAVTISSEWKQTRDEDVIGKTTIDAGNSVLFAIRVDGVEISGLKIINGDHPISASAKTTIIHNHFENNRDAISMEGGSGGYIAYNLIENDRDDGIDMDIGDDAVNKIGSDVVVEFNSIINSHDDGIEVRLFKRQNQNIQYEIRHNRFIGSGKAGIQLISYDVNTGKVFNIHHNLFRGCKTGLGCMEGAKTDEDLSGATKLDERVYFFNNTIVENEMAATGGNNILAFNNIISGHTIGGFKRFGKNSIIANNLFFDNNDADFVEINSLVIKSKNTFNKDPLLNSSTFIPDDRSCCVDAGIEKYKIKKPTHWKISSDMFTGKAPDLGAFEAKLVNPGTMKENVLLVDAGKDLILTSPQNSITLSGKINNNSGEKLNISWQLLKGPANIQIIDASSLTTKVKFSQQGIYEFSLSAISGQNTSSDRVTVRYINSGEGNPFFIDDATIVIEAEYFSYSYGEFKIMKDIMNGHSIVWNDEQKNKPPSLEFSIGASQSSLYHLWIKAKSISNKSKLSVEFNNKEIEIIEPNSDLKWSKLHKSLFVTPGQWNLLLKKAEGVILLDKIILTNDEKFVPE